MRSGSAYLQISLAKEYLLTLHRLFKTYFFHLSSGGRSCYSRLPFLVGDAASVTDSIVNGSVEPNFADICVDEIYTNDDKANDMLTMLICNCDDAIKFIQKQPGYVKNDGLKDKVRAILLTCFSYACGAQRHGLYL